VRAHALILAGLLLGPGLAAAGEPEQLESIPPKARVLAAKGREAHDKGDYARAIAAFKEAYVIAPAPALLFNLAQAYRLQGNCDDAALMYHRYLNTGPSPEGREVAQTHLATVERCMHQRALAIPLDDSMAYLKVPAVPDLGIVDAPGPAPATSSAHLEKDIGIGVTIGGVAALGIATFYGFRAHAAAQDVERAYAMGAKWKEVEATHARGERAARIGKIFGIGGGLAAATGITLFVLGKRSERALPVVITPTTRGAEVSYAWAF
jgi:tetratricopeptide (TPR) repeat protein